MCFLTWVRVRLGFLCGIIDVMWDGLHTDPFSAPGAQMCPVV